MGIRALFVDDDPALLASIRRQLFSLRIKWDVAFANNGYEALEILETKSFDIIVSDMRMPEMDGAQLFAKVQQLYPDTIRVILSGQSETQQVEQVLGTAHMLLKKPCKTQTVVNLVHHCSAMRQRMLKSSVGTLITGRNQWLGSSSAISDLLRLLRDPEVKIEQVAAAIAKDMVISARVLGLLNSAFFGLAKPISKVEQAVVMLGINAIKAIYTGVKSSEFVALNPLANSLATEAVEHSIKIADRACSLLKVDRANKEDLLSDCFLAALLRDLGMVILASVDEQEYAKILADSNWSLGRNSESLVELERERMGCSHTEAGAYQLSIWGFDPRVVQAVLVHHDLNQPESADEYSLIAKALRQASFEFEESPTPVPSQAPDSVLA